jgi:GxxExxY protein
MNADEHRSELNRITEQIIGCAYRVSNTLGIGFLEKVYENALAIELRSSGMTVEQQFPLSVLYSDQVVGEFSIDLLVEGCVIVELKAARAFDDAHFAQCMNYLRAGLTACLLVNFGVPRVQIKRIVSSFQPPIRDPGGGKIGVYRRSSVAP